ncbi:SDR family NAD(P)-dependent oxidoreductase [Pelomicrobium methylotrophicum]|uniref:SDR family NAD(P)-dependent oxidoreductase n=1 Tax=Pelomicrobium methylotrophicum TaxID=2602750 RepID=A0A5C7EV05_9PROT|nr:SDR family NAD(P)-dependent oxidoreductase [Pelomicrobium methylotrophicum]TXF12637.1 SDR family NAD(P)-dependent oxidoreductase [Pelomicrobium methylotrophicum]
MQIPDHVFLVAGGASGLGAATARMLVAEGGSVVILDLNETEGQALKQALGSRACFVQGSVTEEAHVQAAVEAAGRLGPLRGAINCAGIALGERVVGKQGPHSLASFSRTVQVNLVGTFNVLRLAAAAMSVLEPLPSGERGVIVNTASVAAFDGQVGQAAYAASKAGVVGMALPIARELARFGIRVMTIAPGVFDTPMVAAMTDEIRASLAAQVPFPPRLGRPEEYAALVKHILENEMLNAEVIRLDGAVRLAAR